MGRKAKELSAKEVRDLRHPGKSTHAIFAVGGVDGLLLQVTPSNARSWILRCKVGAKRRHIGLGGFPDVSLAQARERAREAKDAIRRGIDPIEERRAAQAALAASQARGLTFADAVDKYCAAKLGEFRNEKHRKQWRATLDNYAVPEIGKMMVAEIEVQDVLRVLNQQIDDGGTLWENRTETASRLRGRIENVLAWATVQGHRAGDNSARWKGNLDAILPKPAKLAKVAHHPALASADVPAWFVDLRARNGIATRALEFLALTAARSGEVRGATWAEIDLGADMWIIPGARMKAGRPHRVPLPPEAVELLESLPRMDGTPYVFFAPRGGMLSDMALSACMRRINAAHAGGYLDPRTGRAAVPHGLRSAFRDWAAERGYQRDMAEMALAHNVGTEVERAYRRSDMLERRRVMMTAWGRFLRGEAEAKVVAMGAAR